MRLLLYKGLDLRRVKAAFDKIKAAIEADDFRSADVKKLNAGPYYRAKLASAEAVAGVAQSTGASVLRKLCAPFTPEDTAARTGLSAAQDPRGRRSGPCRTSEGSGRYMSSPQRLQTWT